MGPDGWSPPAGNHGEGLVHASSTDCSSALASTPRTAGQRSRGSGAHGAAVVASDAELLASTLPFLDAGLRAGDLVVLSCPSESVELISAELGERAAQIESEPRVSLLGSRAPDALEMAR